MEEICDMSEFVIENGILKEYTGDLDHVVIPDSVTVINMRVLIGDLFFVKSITIPESVTAIG